MKDRFRMQQRYRPPKHSKKLFQNHSSDSEEFELEYHQIKKLGLSVNKKKLSVGNWTPHENLIYMRFLEANRKDFLCEKQRRKNKVFYRLSKTLKKRTPDQCRSHHQKLQLKFDDNIDLIIESMKRKLQKKCPDLLEQDLNKPENKRQKVTGAGLTEEDRGKGIRVLEDSMEKGYRVEVRENSQTWFRYGGHLAAQRPQVCQNQVKQKVLSQRRGRKQKESIFKKLCSEIRSKQASQEILDIKC